jgi:hypothetical protein
VGRLLSLELFPILGICILLLDNQLFDGRLWRSCAAADVADLGPGRECRRCAHVWTFREPPVCHRDLSCSARGRVPTGIGETGLINMPDISATASGHPRQLFGRMPRMIALPVLASGASGIHCRSAAKSKWQFRANTSEHNFVVTFDEPCKTGRRHSMSNGEKTSRPCTTTASPLPTWKP